MSLGDNRAWDLFEAIQVYCESFHELSRDLRIPRLQLLLLGGIHVFQDDLTTMFEAHAGTLREVCLSSVSLLGSWRTVLTVMRDQLQQLTKVDMTKCSVIRDGCKRDHYIRFQDDSGSTSYDFEVVGGSPLPMNRLIRGLREGSTEEVYYGQRRPRLTITVDD